MLNLSKNRGYLSTSSLFGILTPLWHVPHNEPIRITFHKKGIMCPTHILLYTRFSLPSLSDLYGLRAVTTCRPVARIKVQSANSLESMCPWSLRKIRTIEFFDRYRRRWNHSMLTIIYFRPFEISLVLVVAHFAAHPIPRFIVKSFRNSFGHDSLKNCTRARVS